MASDNPFQRYIEEERKHSSVKGISSTGARYVTVAPSRKTQDLRRLKEKGKAELSRLGRNAFRTSRGLSRFAYHYGKKRATNTRTGKRLIDAYKKYQQTRAEINRLKG